VNEESGEARYQRLQAKWRAEERRYWRRMLWLGPVIVILFLILVPVVMVALGLWMNFLTDWARSLLHG
jgi:ABC-type Fe3+ transport system permease subunit